MIGISVFQLGFVANINEIVEAYEAPYAMSLRQYIEQISVSVNSGFVMGIDESEGKKKLVFDSAQPAAERYLAIADAFGMELSYSFDIKGGTNWPYSGIFWQGSTDEIQNINITTGGTCRRASITIKVDGKQVLHHGNCASHKHYNFH